MRTDRSHFAAHFTARLQTFLDQHLPCEDSTLSMLERTQSLTQYFIGHMMAAIREHADTDEMPAHSERWP